MAKVDRFEDLIAWQKARELTTSIYKVTRKNDFARDFGLSSQIQRSAVSVMANIAEGFERFGKGEFHQFLSIAKSSCAEVRSHLYVALDVGYLTNDEFTSLSELATSTARIVGKLRSSVKASNYSVAK